MQRIKRENFLNRTYKIVRILIIISWLGILIYSTACSAPYKTHKRHKAVSCPLEKNRREFHTYY
jgi:hypothetical protein